MVLFNGIDLPLMTGLQMCMQAGKTWDINLLVALITGLNSWHNKCSSYMGHLSHIPGSRRRNRIFWWMGRKTTPSVIAAICQGFCGCFFNQVMEFSFSSSQSRVSQVFGVTVEHRNEVWVSSTFQPLGVGGASIHPAHSGTTSLALAALCQVPGDV